jgi:hypothetical protein
VTIRNTGQSKRDPARQIKMCSALQPLDIQVVDMTRGTRVGAAQDAAPTVAPCVCATRCRQNVCRRPDARTIVAFMRPSGTSDRG